MRPMEENADLPMHVLENRRMWDANAPDWVAEGERLWAAAAPSWGIWGVSESELAMLPADMHGMRAIELGCGTGYGSAWMARRGAVVIGVDNSERQLATARRLAAEHGIELELWHGNAEATPFADASFDFALSEYGASIWCDPYAWLPEAHRLLKPGGRLVFLSNHPLASLCGPADGGPLTRRLERPYFDLHRLDWTQAEIDPGGIEFSLPLSRWFALFRSLGFLVEDLREPRATRRGDDRKFVASHDWGSDFPAEIVFKLRKG